MTAIHGPGKPPQAPGIPGLGRDHDKNPLNPGFRPKDFLLHCGNTCWKRGHSPRRNMKRFRFEYDLSLT